MVTFPGWPASLSIMSVVYLHDTPQALRLQVVGALTAAAAAELEQSFLTAASILGLRPVIVDLSSATSIADSARVVLQRLAARGARLLTAGGAVEAAAAQLAARPPVALPSAPLPLPRRLWCSLARFCRAACHVTRLCLPCLSPQRKLF
jgi:hypothetical protein